MLNVAIQMVLVVLNYDLHKPISSHNLLGLLCIQSHNENQIDLIIDGLIGFHSRYSLRRSIDFLHMIKSILIALLPF